MLELYFIIGKCVSRCALRLLLLHSTCPVYSYKTILSRYSNFSPCIMDQRRYIMNAVSMHLRSSFTVIAQFPLSDMCANTVDIAQVC